MVVDRDDRFLNSVDKPVLAQVVPRFEDDKLCLDAPGMDSLRVPIQLNTKEIKDLRYLSFGSTYIPTSFPGSLFFLPPGSLVPSLLGTGRRGPWE